MSERTRRALGWTSILWFASALGFAAGDIVALEAPAEVRASCGDNVTLTCDASSLKASDIRVFAWLDGEKTLCQHSAGRVDPEVLCEVTPAASRHRLTLTLLNVMPVNERKYICKLQSSLGAMSTSTNLTMTHCLKSNGSSNNSSQAHCWFAGVYPRGIVHWVQGDDDLTDAAVTEEEEDEEGRFNISSTVSTEQRNQSQPYRCSLCLPDDGTCLSTQRITVERSTSAGGQLDRLHWICVLLEIIMFKSVT